MNLFFADFIWRRHLFISVCLLSNYYFFSFFRVSFIYLVFKCLFFFLHWMKNICYYFSYFHVCRVLSMSVQIFGLLFVPLVVGYSEYFHFLCWFVYLFIFYFCDQTVSYNICGFNFFCEVRGVGNMENLWIQHFLWIIYLNSVKLWFKRKVSCMHIRDFTSPFGMI